MNENMTTAQAFLRRTQVLTEIGEVYYEKHRKGEIATSNEEKSLFEEISQLDIFIGKANGSYEKNLTNCPQCQEALVGSGAFCAKCGCSIQEYRTEQMKTCSCCGAKIIQQNYCDVCGVKVIEE